MASGESLLTTGPVVIRDWLPWQTAATTGELAVVTGAGKLTNCLCGEL